jgi:rubrerythrin
MLCSNCRNENPSTADVCVHCGSDLTASIEIELLADSGPEPTPQAVATPAPPVLEVDIDDSWDPQEEVLQVSFDDDAGPPGPDDSSGIAGPLPPPSPAMSPPSPTPESDADGPSHYRQGRRVWIAAAIAAIVMVGLVLASNAGIKPHGHPDHEVAPAPPPAAAQVPPSRHWPSGYDRPPGSQTRGNLYPPDLGPAARPYPPERGQAPSWNPVAPPQAGREAEAQWRQMEGQQRRQEEQVRRMESQQREQQRSLERQQQELQRRQEEQIRRMESQQREQQRKAEEQQRRQEEQVRQMESQQREQQRKAEERLRELQRQQEQNTPVRYVCSHCGTELMRTKSQGSPSSFDGGSCSQGRSFHSWSRR